MIISHKHKYLFIEIPQTGTSAIHKTLCDYYEGEEILHKHANYREFEKIATKEEKKYFVFAAVRNPLDNVSSFYQKFLNFPSENYKNRDKEIHEFINQGHSFKDYLMTFYRQPYTSPINDNKIFCDYIMRFEKLNSEFTKVLEKINIPITKKLNTFNKTKNKKPYLDYYPKDTELIKHVKTIFLPFMEEWNYDFPKEWRDIKIRKNKKIISKIQYEIIKMITFNSSKNKNYTTRQGKGDIFFRSLSKIKNIYETTYKNLKMK